MPVRGLVKFSDRSSLVEVESQCPPFHCDSSEFQALEQSRWNLFGGRRHQKLLPKFVYFHFGFQSKGTYTCQVHSKTSNLDKSFFHSTQKHYSSPSIVIDAPKIIRSMNVPKFFMPNKTLGIWIWIAVSISASYCKSSNVNFTRNILWFKPAGQIQVVDLRVADWAPYPGENWDMRPN